MACGAEGGASFFGVSITSTDPLITGKTRSEQDLSFVLREGLFAELSQA